MRGEPGACAPGLRFESSVRKRPLSTLGGIHALGFDRRSVEVPRPTETESNALARNGKCVRANFRLLQGAVSRSRGLGPAGIEDSLSRCNGQELVSRLAGGFQPHEI